MKNELCNYKKHKIQKRKFKGYIQTYLNYSLKSPQYSYEKEFDRIEAIISSMTTEEREDPKLLNASRRIRIANGSGTEVQDINKFIKSFEMTRDMMKKMQSGKMDPKMKKMMKGMGMDKLQNMSEEELADLEKKLKG